MSIKQGIKAFGERGNDNPTKEINQLHVRKALLPLRKEDMSYRQRKSATIPNVLKRKTRWHDQSQRLCRQEVTAIVHFKIRH